MSTALDDLIARLEAATGPDRCLDMQICLEVFEQWRPGIKRDQDMIGREPAFTASLDAALTLMTEGYEWTLRRRPHGDWMVTFGRDWESGSDAVLAPTASLALCIAALRARGTLATSQERT